MNKGASSNFQHQAFSFPYAQIDNICRDKNWNKIEQMINDQALAINYPFINGQIIGNYPYGYYQTPYTTLDYLYHNGLPSNILHKLQETYNAFGYNDIYAFQCALSGYWDIVASIRFNPNLTHLSSGMTMSDYAYEQEQKDLANYYYSKNNICFIRKPPSPILSPQPIKPNKNTVSQLEEIVHHLVEDTLTDKASIAMLKAAEENNWQVVMSYIYAGHPIDAKDAHGKDLLDWANFYEMDEIINFLYIEALCNLAIGSEIVPYTPLNKQHKKDVGYVGKEREEVLARQQSDAEAIQLTRHMKNL